MSNFNIWTCPHCGSQNSSAFCTNCGSARPEVPVDQTAQMPLGAQPIYTQPAAPQQSFSTQPMQDSYAPQGYVPPAQQPGPQPYAQQAPYNQPYQPPMPQAYDAGYAPVQPGSAFPGWKTSVLFSILGIFAASILQGIVAAISDTALDFYLVAFIAVALFYCLKVYGSYFTEKPMTSDSKVISFCNTFFGGLIFGCLWNHNLTRGKKGISNIVFAVIAVIALIGAVASFALDADDNGAPEATPPAATENVTDDDSSDDSANKEKEVDDVALVTAAAEADFNQIKNLDDDFLSQIIDEDTASSFTELGITAEDFMKSFLSGFDYEITNVTVNGDSAEVEVVFTCKTYDQIMGAAEDATETLLADPDVYSYSEEELTAKIGQLMLSGMNDQQPVKGDPFTLTYVKTDGIWQLEDTQQNSDAISNHLLLAPEE